MNLSLNNEMLSPSQFAEKMTANVIRYYNDPETCFSIANELFHSSYCQWSDSEKIRSLMSFFRDCYKAYSAEEKRELGNRFLSFTSNLNLDERTYDQLFESFFLLIRKRSEASDFIVNSIQKDCYMSVVNKKFKEEFHSPDFSLFRDIFVRRIEEIADYLYDETYLSIAQALTDRYTLYDSVMKALLKRNKQKVLLAFLNNGNLLISSECLEAIIQYAKKNGLSDLLKYAYHTFLYKTSVTFDDFYSYYVLLSDKEREMDAVYLEKIIEANNLESPFLISQRRKKNPLLLKGLTVKEFGFLSDIIKEDYKKEYLPYLIASIKNRLSFIGNDYSDLFSCLEKFKEDWKEILKLKELNEVSHSHDAFRKQYFLMLLETDSLSFANIKVYQD